MGLRYENLLDIVRRGMCSELDDDARLGRVYMSSRLVPGRETVWVDLLRRAATEFTDDWLAENLARGQLLRSHEQVMRSGRATSARVPSNAALLLAEGEFNRLYIRGLCLVLAESGGGMVEVYRAKEPMNPRAASEHLLGSLHDAAAVLEDMRAHPGSRPNIGVPAGPASGISVRASGSALARLVSWPSEAR